MTVRANKPAFNIREKLKELTQSIGLKGRELMRAATAQDARDLISAGRKNIFHNGSMTVFQRNTNSTGISNNSSLYTLDRWRSEITGPAATYTISQESDAPDGFGNSLKYLVTTAQASPSAGVVTLFDQRIEGQNLQQLKFGTSEAKAITVSFWVKSNAPGTYILEAADTDNVVIINKSYTINNSGVWEYKTVTIPGNSAGSGFNNDNNQSLDIRWWLAAGSNFTSGSTLKDTWGAAVNTQRVVGQTNLGAANNNYFMITGVQCEVGKNATEFEHRSYGEELALCQRYYVKFAPGTTNTDLGTGYMNTTTGALVSIPFPTTMRAAPTVSDFESSAGSRLYIGYQNTTINASSIAYSGASTNMARLIIGLASSGTIGNGISLRTRETDGFIAFSVEL